MTRPTRRTSVAGPLAPFLALLALACQDAPTPDTAGTSATTRALLDQSAVVAGPSTAFEGDSEVDALTRRATRVFLPELGYNYGRAEAPLKLIEFSDYGCGFCRRFHDESFPALKERYVDTGRIEWKLIPFITGLFDNSIAVSEASECMLEQGPARFEPFNDRLWERQGDWKPSGDVEALARAWARELGADMPRYDSCLAEDRRIERVAGATVAARELGVRGTPTFWIVGYGPIQGALPLDVLTQMLDVVLQMAESQADAPAPGAPGAAPPRGAGPGG
jgi:protein-disulfide isomerase